MDALLAHPSIDVNARASVSTSFKCSVSTKMCLFTHSLPIYRLLHVIQSGETALMMAAVRGHITVLQALLAHPLTSVNVRTNVSVSIYALDACNISGNK